MKQLFKRIKLGEKWKKVKLKKFNDFFLVAIKKNKATKKGELDLDCVKKIRFEVAVDSGKKGKYVIYNNQIVLNFNDFSSTDVDFNKKVASTKLIGFPSTFYIRVADMTGEFSTVTEGHTSIEVYLNELRLK